MELSVEPRYINLKILIGQRDTVRGIRGVVVTISNLSGECVKSGYGFA